MFKVLHGHPEEVLINMILKEPNIIEVCGIGCNVVLVQNVVRYFGMCLFCCEGPTTRTCSTYHYQASSISNMPFLCPQPRHDQQNKPMLFN